MVSVEEKRFETPPGSAAETLVATPETQVVKPPETSGELARLVEGRAKQIGDRAVLATERGAYSLKVGLESLGGTPTEVRQGQEEIKKIQEEIAALPAEAQAKMRFVLGGTEAVPVQTEIQGKENFVEQAQQDEAAYLAGHKKSAELKTRYENKTTEAGYVLSQIQAFAKERGAEHSSIPELQGQPFGPEQRRLIFEAVKKQAEVLLLNKERGSFNQKKYESVVAEAGRYLDLVAEAQQEGDIPRELDAEAVLKMAEENLYALAFQDRVASENLLGDHGVRHLVDHNITISEKILDQLAARGQKVKAIDRVLVHQVMIDHDLGYAMSPVRDAINKDGIQGQDAGHNLLAAKFVRQRAENGDDHLNRIFSKEQLAVIHTGILNHDSSRVDIRLGEDSPEARQANVESAIHIADNTHAFEDKLPEILYSVPESLETMRLMKTAGELGDSAMIDRLKIRLAEQIKNNPNFGEDDKQALDMAVKGLSKNSFKFSVGRICGNKPEVTIDQNGGVEIKVQESAIHREAVGLFGQQSYDQLRKFIADLTGLDKSQVTDEILNQNKIGNEKVSISLDLQNNRATERTDYQKQVEELIKNPDFQTYIGSEEALASQEAALKTVSSENMETLVTGNELRANGDTRPAAEIIAERVAAIQKERENLLADYLAKKK